MKKAWVLLFVCLQQLAGHAQTSCYKFDFGNGKLMPGYTKVTTDTKYNDATGYGFDKYADDIVSKSAMKGNTFLSDYITSPTAFYFSVKLPEGNYDVKVILGDYYGTTDATIRAECRRLMVEKVTTVKGKFATVNFTVHVKDSLIRNEKNEVVSKVRLKEREVGYLHWDNKLTLEFNGPAPKICAVEITPNKTATTVSSQAIPPSWTRTKSPGRPGDK